MTHLGTGLRSTGSTVLRLLVLPIFAWNAALRFRRSMCEPACAHEVEPLVDVSAYARGRPPD